MNITRLSIFTLVVSLVLGVSANETKERRSAFINLLKNQKFDSVGFDDDQEINQDDVTELRQADPIEEDVAATHPDASTGRLFLKKFVLFKNMFSNKPTTTILPIVIAAPPPTQPNTSPSGTTGTFSGTGTVSFPSGTGTPTATFTGTPTGTNTGGAPTTGTGPPTANGNGPPAGVAPGIPIGPGLKNTDSAAGFVIAGELDENTDTDGKQAAIRRGQTTRNRKNGQQMVNLVVPQQYRRYFQNAGNQAAISSNNIRRIPMNNNNRNKKGNKNKKRVNKGNGNRNSNANGNRKVFNRNPNKNQKHQKPKGNRFVQIYPYN